MLKLNCVERMKITTTGTPIGTAVRVNSNCCRINDRVGYIYIDRLLKNTVRVSSESKGRGTTTEFYFEQVHPYFGGIK